MKQLRTALAVVLATISTVSVATGNHAGQPGHADAGDDTAIGAPGNSEKVTRTIQVDMTDSMRFKPAIVRVKKGETVRFKVKNSGQLKHEFVLGTEKELKEHYQLMLKNPEMEHEEPNMITLAGGKAGEVIWHFSRPGKVEFACLQPGHYDAGMKGAVSVAAAGAKPKAEAHKR